LPISIREIKELLECEVVGDDALVLQRFSPLDRAEQDCLSFCTASGDKGKELVRSSRAGAVICHRSVDVSGHPGTFILVDKPRLAFVKVMSMSSLNDAYGRSELAFIHPKATVHPSANIGPFCYIGESVTIGENVIVHPNTTIGKQGFGFERDADGALIRFPHSGRVIIEDDVEIGANCCIDRGTFGNTLIGRGTKIDNLCHIAHNVQIGKDSMIIANVCLCGSCTIGDGTTIAPNSVVREKVTVGSGVLIGLGSVVTKDIEDHSIAYGSPAKVVRKNDSGT